MEEEEAGIILIGVSWVIDFEKVISKCSKCFDNDCLWDVFFKHT